MSQQKIFIENYLLRRPHPKSEMNLTQIGYILADIVCKLCLITKNNDFIVYNLLPDLYIALVNHFYIY